MTGDPLRDPDYPNRPEHQDFWHLSEIILQMDAKVTEQTTSGEGFEGMLGEIPIDIRSLGYMGAHRAFHAISLVGIIDAPMAAWVDGFVAGQRFERRYRHGT